MTYPSDGFCWLPNFMVIKFNIDNVMFNIPDNSFRASTKNRVTPSGNPAVFSSLPDPWLSVLTSR
jgi:hypothetical protein